MSKIRKKKPSTDWLRQAIEDLIIGIIILILDKLIN